MRPLVVLVGSVAAVLIAGFLLSATVFRPPAAADRLQGVTVTLGAFSIDDLADGRNRLDVSVVLTSPADIDECIAFALDEPFSGLDPVNQMGLETVIRDLAANGATVLFSTHVMQHAERLCDRVVLVARGRKAFEGTVGRDRQAAEAFELRAVRRIPHPLRLGRRGKPARIQCPMHRETKSEPPRDLRQLRIKPETATRQRLRRPIIQMTPVGFGRTPELPEDRLQRT